MKKSLLAVPALLLLVVGPDASGHGWWPSRTPGYVLKRVEMTRPDPAPDADAEGSVYLTEYRGRSAIHVRVSHLDPAATYTVKISKGDVTETLGELTTSPIPPPKPVRCFKATLSGAQEVPPVETEARGAALLYLNRDRTVLYYQVLVRDLSGPAVAAHIHPGAVGEEGAPLITLDHEDLRGSVEVTAEQVAALESGNTYVNVHTAANPDGEVRGQVGNCSRPDDEDDRPRGGRGTLRIDTAHGDTLPLGADSLSDLSGATIQVLNSAGAVVLTGVIPEIAPPPPPPPPRCFSARLDGAQEVPPVATEATGRAFFYLWGRDRSLLIYYVKVEGLSGAVTAAHIHPGAVGEEGAPLIPLDTDLRGSVEVTPEQVAALESGNTYVNVHTEANPDGEIRGQVGRCEHTGDRDGDDNDGGENPPADGEANLQGSEPFFDEFAFDVEGSHDASFRRGDVNDDGHFDIADPAAALGYLFRGDAAPYCLDSLDANDDGRVDLGDPISMLFSLFGGQGPLPAPGNEAAAGFDPTQDDLFCDQGR